MKHEAVDLLFIISFYLCRRKLFGFNKKENRDSPDMLPKGWPLLH